MKVAYSNTPSNNKSTTFASRNPEIRFADDVLRRAHNEFPRFSVTRLCSNITNRKNITREQTEVLLTIQNKLDELRSLRPDIIDNPSDYVKVVLIQIKKFMLGNCGESATLSKVGLAVNGIDGKKVELWGFKDGVPVVNLNHSGVLVNCKDDFLTQDYKTFGKKAYFVGLSKNDTDYVPAAFSRFAEGCLKSEEFRSVGANTIGVLFNDFTIDAKTLDLIKKVFPNFEIKKRLPAG